MTRGEMDEVIACDAGGRSLAQPRIGDVSREGAMMGAGAMDFQHLSQQSQPPVSYNHEDQFPVVPKKPPKTQ